MTNTKSTKRALLSSVLALFLCFAMLLGSTYAWFTDEVTSGSNVIQSGTLDVDLVDAAGNSMEGEVIDFVDMDANDLWEPGCTYSTEPVYVVNNGNLALKYNVVINGIEGDAKLLEAIEWTVTVGEGDEAVTTDLDKLNGYLLPEDGKNKSKAIVLTGHMKEDAGNEYMGLTASGISITVFATQYTYESDSKDNQYDLAATWVGTIPASLEDTTLKIVPGDSAENRGTITVNSPEDLVYLPKLAAEWASLYSDGNGTEYSNYANGKGAAYYYTWQWKIELGTDLDMNNIPMNPIDTTLWGTIDGNDHTISNVVVESSDSNYVALFSFVNDIEELNVNNVKVSGKDDVGAVVGFCRGSMDNVHVTNATIEGGNYIGTVAGVVYGGITNSSATNSTVTATGMTVGGLAGYALVETSGNTAENVTVVGTYNVGGLLGQAQNETVADNTVKNVTVISTTEAIEEWGGECRSDEVAAFKYNATVGTNTVENVTTQEWGGDMPETLVVTPDEANNTGTITVNTAEDLMYLNKLAENWVSFYSNGQGTNVGSYYVQNGGKGGAYYYDWTWTVKLGADIDLYNFSVDPISITSWGTFDGQGHTIKNAKIVTDSTTENSAGLFNANQCSVKNVKLDNIHVTGSNVGNSTAGVLSGSCNQGVDNVTVTNSTVTGGKYTGGVVGYGYTDVTNCTLENVTVKGGYKLGGVIGYICASGTNTGEVTGNKLTDCTVDGLGNGVYAGGKTQYIIGKVVGNYNCNGTCNDNTITNMTTSATDDIGQIEAGVKVNGVWHVGTADGLQTALAAGENVVLTDDVANNNVTVSNGYGVTGYSQTKGGVLDGNGNTMTVTGANGTWGSAINTTGGTIKNITVTGAFRGIFINHNSDHSEKVILENVIIDGTTYTISCDQGTYQGLKATNCTFNGWTSYAATLGAAEFIECTFGEGNGYAYCRPYADTTFTNCVFEEGYEFDATKECTSTFINCYVGDTLITSENVVALLGDSAANIIVQNG